MKNISLILKTRGALLAALLVVLGSALGLTAPVQEAHSATCAWRPTIRTYYSDATYKTTIGQRGVDCMCNDVYWGETSSFVIYEQQCCPYFTC
jgi:hypothetical protein